MVVGAEPHCFGMRLENVRFFGPDMLQEAKRQVHMLRKKLRIL
jgi:hypothetical protein